MAEKTEKVKVKLTHAAYVGGKLRQAGEEVEVRSDLVEEFTRPTEADQLKAMGKEELLSLAAERGVAVTKDNNKDEIAQKILDAKK
jgi:uncharacterized protein YidB (DUF937 family)